MSPSDADPGKTRRLFFAAWPDADIRSAIVARRARLGELTRRRIPDHDLHLTLLFLGNQPANRIDQIQSFTEGISTESLTLVLDRLGWFARAQVAWLGGPAPPSALALVDRLEARMNALGLRFDRRPFRPHVTLFRRVRQRPEFPALEPLHWPVNEISLIESIPGRPYQVLRIWSLSSGS